MDALCPRCGAPVRKVARFCARCGLRLERGPDGYLDAGRVPHPHPVPPPPNWRAVRQAADLHFRWESAWGGEPILGTEGLAVMLLNGGYPLRNAEIEVVGYDGEGCERFKVKAQAYELPRGRDVRVEVPSYELPNCVCRELTVTLLSAEFGSEM